MVTGLDFGHNDHMKRSARLRRLARSAIAVAVAAILAVVGAVPLIDDGPAAAADLSQFQPGNIISDAVFFNSSTMTEAQIQSFLQSKVPSCQAGYTCLKEKRDNSRTTAADAMCGAYQGAQNETAARIIYKVAQACGINPQVLLVTLQKEQGLVTHTWPSEWRYTIAMGQGCPDTAACDTRYHGFFNQVYGAAWQFKRYANPPGTSAYFTWYAPGKTWNVLYNPNQSCGSSPVRIENQATANLYYYTPYQPNTAALRAGYGEGDACSSYGNRNFYNYFTDWFGQPSYAVTGVLNDYWQSQGAASGWIGAPTAAMRTWSGLGWSQRFAGADLYLASDGANRVFATIGGTRDEYRLVGEAASGLGWPAGQVYGAAGGWYQDFRGGRIYVRPSDGAGFAVASPINEVYESNGNIGGFLGWPSSRAYRYADGSRQDFAGGAIFQGPTATVALDKTRTADYLAAGGPTALGWPTGTAQSTAGDVTTLTGGVLVRTSTGVVKVTGEINRVYASLGGPTGALGAPRANEETEGAAKLQRFASGTIYSTSAGTYAVTALSAALTANGGTAALGYPSAAQVGSGSSFSQNFSGGTTLTTGSAGSFPVGGAIGRTYRAMGGATSYLGAATGPERRVADGYVQDFEGGQIICSPLATVALPKVVAKVYTGLGANTSRLGWPTAGAAAEPGGWRQSFAGGDIYASSDGGAGGAVVGTTLRTARIAGGPAVLGYPTGNETESASGWSQTFQKGVVFVPRSGQASAIVGDILSAYQAAGGASVLGFAVTPAAVSVGGALAQRFESGVIYRTSTGTFVTRGYIRTHYEKLGGPGGVLGLPRGDEFATAGGHRQDFAGGSILVSSTGAFVARGALGAEYFRRGGETGPLGWPLGNEVTGNGTWSQRFQGGTLVLYSTGRYEVR